jgi:HTH-type transcriptional regulator, cell division transcriptional repressor
MPEGTIFAGEVDEDTLGSRIIRSRESNGMTSADVARKLGVKKTTYEAWEADRSEPRAHHIVRLAGMLGVSPAWMLGGVGDAPSEDTIDDEIMLVQQQIANLKEMRAQTDQAILSLENAISRLIRSKED